jgi:hypothetical protein
MPSRRLSLPQFLVISPAKTGSTWLADNLRCHPQIFVPAVKEVKYFSSLYKWLDGEWYASHFDPREGQIAGEASPSYAALPVERIRAIREMMPNAKLIFLMRDPLARAWSHVKHMHRFREAGFGDCTSALDEVTDEQWRQAFADDWTLASGDYLGHLGRWLSVFPREQIFVNFFEAIIERPVALLRDIFSFLGVDSTIDLSSFPVEERILSGPAAGLPAHLEKHLRQLLDGRTRQLAGFLRDQFALTPPNLWSSPLRDHEPTWSFNDADLARITAREETFRTAYRQLHLDYRGFDLLFYRGRLLGVPIGLGPVQSLDGPALEQHLRTGAILTAPTLDELKECTTRRILEQHAGKLCTLERELREAREVTARLRIDLQTLVEEVRRPLPPLWKRKLRGFGRRIARQLSIFG